MKLEALKKEKTDEFIRYCKKHKSEVDESFLHDEDLKEFVPDEENPTYIITDEQGEIKAVASLIIDDYFRRGRKGRFRIFHSELEDIKYYDMMLQAICKDTKDIDKLFVYVSLEKKELVELTEALGFVVDRYSFEMVREVAEIPDFSLPEDYEIKPFVLGKDEASWCYIRNTSFAKLKGSEIPITPEMVAGMMTAEDDIEGGSMILYHGEKAVGIVRGSTDDYEGEIVMNIGPLAIIPEYQGKGLGRALLRASLGFARDKGYKRIILCVNAENERAKALYIDEGFKQVEAVACYRYDLI